jgi:hypothetical protein
VILDIAVAFLSYLGLGLFPPSDVDIPCVFTWVADTVTFLVILARGCGVAVDVLEGKSPSLRGHRLVVFTPSETSE